MSGWIWVWYSSCWLTFSLSCPTAETWFTSGPLRLVSWFICPVNDGIILYIDISWYIMIYYCSWIGFWWFINYKQTLQMEDHLYTIAHSKQWWHVLCRPGLEDLDHLTLDSAHHALFYLKTRLITLWWTNIAMERSTIFNGKIHYKWPFSIAMLVHQRVI